MRGNNEILQPLLDTRITTNGPSNAVQFIKNNMYGYSSVYEITYAASLLTEMRQSCTLIDR